MDQPHPSVLGKHAVALGLVVNAALAVVKGAAGWFGNSYALMADAIESTTDVVSSLIVWYALHFAAKPADRNHPYGHGKVEPLAAVVVSLILLGAAVVITRESIHEIRVPHHAPAPFTLVVLVVVVVIKEILARFVEGAGKTIESTALNADAWHHRADALSSGLAFIGISVALVGGKGYESADDWAAIGAAVIIAGNACALLWPAILELVDTAPSCSLEDDIRGTASIVDGVLGIGWCNVRKIGLTYAVELQVMMDGDITLRRGHAIADRVEEVIREAHGRITHVLVHLEPHEER